MQSSLAQNVRGFCVWHANYYCLAAASGPSARSRSRLLCCWGCFVPASFLQGLATLAALVRRPLGQLSVPSSWTYVTFSNTPCTTIERKGLQMFWTPAAGLASSYSIVSAPYWTLCSTTNSDWKGPMPSCVRGRAPLAILAVSSY
jgi:hypothetical protein